MMEKKTHPYGAGETVGTSPKTEATFIRTTPCEGTLVENPR
jgi:hypothetical protein